MLVVHGSFATVSLALASVKRHVTMVSRLRLDAALYHRPGLQHPLASAVPNPRRGSAHAVCRGGRRAQTSPGRPSKYTGMAATKKIMSLLAHGPVRQPQVAPSRSVMYLWPTPRANCAGNVLLYRPPNHAHAGRAVGRDVLIGGGYVRRGTSLSGT